MGKRGAVTPQSNIDYHSRWEVVVWAQTSHFSDNASLDGNVGDPDQRQTENNDRVDQL